MDPRALSHGANQAQNSGWKHVCFPIHTGPDRLVPLGRGQVYCWPSGANLMPKIMDRAAQERFKAEIGERGFSAQYLQQPLAAGGAVFRLDWIGSYPVSPSRADCIAIFQSRDVAVKRTGKMEFNVRVGVMECRQPRHEPAYKPRSRPYRQRAAHLALADPCLQGTRTVEKIPRLERTEGQSN